MVSKDDTVLPLKFVDISKGFIIDTLDKIKCGIESFDKSLSGELVYLLYQGIYLKNGLDDTLIYKYTGYSDSKTGNGIFDIDISDDGTLVLIPVLKTNYLQFLTYSGKGEVILYDVSKRKIIKSINKRMLKPKISPDKKLIAYFYDSEKIMIYEISTGKTMDLSKGNDFEWIK